MTAFQACLSLLLAANPHRVVIEVNVPGQTAYGIVLNNVENLRKALAPETVEVEIVCHGAGIEMLRLKDARLRKRAFVLAKSGVRFAACANTLRGKHLTKASLFPFAVVVPSGVAEVVRRQEAGWSYLKGAY